jgi:hypothetical protein
VVTSNVNWPEWWQWELDCSNPHLLKRMLDRSFSETNLREMLETATGYRADAAPGRFIIEAVRAGQSWEVIVEPDAVARILIVITAYAVG